MKTRSLIQAVVMFCAVSWSCRPVDAQSLTDLAQTAAYAAAQQNADGGFPLAAGEPSTLGATNTALRALENVGGAAPDVAGCIRFVRSCKLPGSGFAQRPGGKPDAVATAIGLLAAAELKIADRAMIDDAVAYFGANAKSFEDVRMSIAGLEGVAARSPDFDRWARQIEAMRQPDGTFGSGPSQAFATGGAAAAILRMGMNLEQRDAVVASLRAGQRPDGAWSRDGGPSDLSSSYRVMRALYMLRERPNVEALRGFIASCRKPHGAYSSTPGGPGNLGAAYYATILLRWLRLLEGGGSALESAAFAPLVSGSDLSGWEGDTSLWSAADGVLVGKSPGLNHNEFLATRKSYRNFILSVRFRLAEGSGNSGIQFRSVRVPGTEMSGYQADIGESYWGCLYDESRRNRVLARASEEALKRLSKDGWNHYVVFAMGNVITLYLNGAPAVVYREEGAGIAPEGQIAVQIHGGGPMKVEFKDVLIRTLP